MKRRGKKDEEMRETGKNKKKTDCSKWEDDKIIKIESRNRGIGNMEIKMRRRNRKQEEERTKITQTES